MSSMNIVKRTGERTEPSKIPLEAEYSGESWSPEEITDLLLLYMLSMIDQTWLVLFVSPPGILEIMLWSLSMRPFLKTVGKAFLICRKAQYVFLFLRPRYLIVSLRTQAWS